MFSPGEVARAQGGQSRSVLPARSIRAFSAVTMISFPPARVLGRRVAGGSRPWPSRSGSWRRESLEITALGSRACVCRTQHFFHVRISLQLIKKRRATQIAAENSP